MKRNRISAADPGINVVLITLDHHMTAAVEEAQKLLADDMPSANLSIHAATDWDHSEDALTRCKHDIAEGDIIVHCKVVSFNVLGIDISTQITDELVCRHDTGCDVSILDQNTFNINTCSWCLFNNNVYSKFIIYTHYIRNNCIGISNVVHNISFNGSTNSNVLGDNTVPANRRSGPQT